MKKTTFFLLIAACLSRPVSAQTHNDDVYKFETISRQNNRYYLSIPNIDHYITLKCDFHVHTDFSDGQVGPVGRVNEAWNDGLDAIAITDHIEIRRYADFMTCDRNKPYQLARERGDLIGLTVIAGAEITRAKPLGHICALFINDAEKLAVDNELEAVEAACKQGAYLIWNHPGYPDGKSDIYPIHKELIAAKKICGVEVFNKRESYPRVFDYCSQYGLAPFANSDIHYMSGSIYKQRGTRPMTLVFATARTPEAIRAALFAGRAVAYFDGYLMGEELYIKQIVDRAIEVHEVRTVNKNKRAFEIINKSDIRFRIRPKSYDYSETIEPWEVLRLDIRRGEEVAFTNCILGKDRYLTRLFWE